MKNNTTVEKWEEVEGAIRFAKADMAVQMVKDFIHHSLQEAKAERDREWIKELKPTGIGNSLYIMPSNHLFDSIKQEEEI